MMNTITFPISGNKDVERFIQVWYQLFFDDFLKNLKQRSVEAKVIYKAAAKFINLMLFFLVNSVLH